MMHPKMRYIYCGIDTHKRTHTATVINCWSEKLGELTFENRPGAFNDFLKEVKSYAGKGITPVFGLEDTGGVGRSLAVFLIKHKQIVKNVDSTLTYSERRNQSIIHKTDSYDSECVARVLLNRFDSLKDASPQDIYYTLSMLVKRRVAIVKASTALKNQVHNYISQHYPSYKKFFHVFDCKTALAFWEKYPSPSKLKGVDSETLGKFLASQSGNFFSAKKATEILELVKKDGDTETEFQSSRDLIVETCIKELKHNREDIKKIEAEMQNLMDRIGQKLETMIGLDLVSAASIIAEVGDISRFQSAPSLAKYAGIAPITYASGDKTHTFKNRYGNRTLYQLFHNLAARQINKGRNKDKPVNPLFLQYYEKKIAQGKTKHQATVAVMRRLVNIVYGMLKNKAEYVHPVLSKEKAE